MAKSYEGGFLVSAYFSTWEIMFCFEPSFSEVPFCVYDVLTRGTQTTQTTMKCGPTEVTLSGEKTLGRVSSF